MLQFANFPYLSALKWPFSDIASFQETYLRPFCQAWSWKSRILLYSTQGVWLSADAHKNHGQLSTTQHAACSCSAQLAMLFWRISWLYLPSSFCIIGFLLFPKSLKNFFNLIHKLMLLFYLQVLYQSKKLTLPRPSMSLLVRM